MELIVLLLMTPNLLTIEHTLQPQPSIADPEGILGLKSSLLCSSTTPSIIQCQSPNYRFSYFGDQSEQTERETDKKIKIVCLYFGIVEIYMVVVVEDFICIYNKYVYNYKIWTDVYAANICFGHHIYDIRLLNQRQVITRPEGHYSGCIYLEYLIRG